ncbi:hypothetical protein GUJ93_ZPchr0011g27909 [Zizania palustris]|uniref:Exocyst subunit Exo70 family protein n=1 Tax=Zizania palustris TaxID=103762 RepID=A0A8J5WDX8_ZIZPA|nr:hypothetical protein GUJ93_ZPchr0011g27909 [Zizania palustris]
MDMMPARRRRTLSATVAAAATLVAKWNPDDNSGNSLFHASDPEPDHFLRAAADLHRVMQLFFASDATNGGHNGRVLVQAQELLDTAMRRLQLELRLLLSAPGQDHDAARLIRVVAEAMMAAGYGKECISTFKERRRAALAATLRRLHTVVEFHKLNWDQVDDSIQSWLAAARVAFSSLFPAEKELCGSVFAGNESVGDAVMAAIANDQATSLLSVAENAVARARRAPERLFRVLDVHDLLTEVLPEILSVFGDRSEVAKRACSVLIKAGEAARGALASLETAIQKEPTKATAGGGAVHPLTRYVMNYLVFLADYEGALDRIWPQQKQQAGIGWLVQVLLRKIEDKGGSYREAALRHLFMANNTHYVATKVGSSTKLQAILRAHENEYREAARRHLDAYVLAAWGKALKAIAAADGVEAAVVEAVATQERWVAADEEMGDALRAAATAAVVPKFRMFYRRHGAAVRLTPGDVNAMIGGLFAGLATDSSG